MTLLLAMLVGCETEPEIREVLRDPTPDELQALCAPELAETKDELGMAQTKVAQLERTAAEKEGQVRELEERIARGAEAGKAQRAELERLKAELATTKEALAQAEVEKQRLLTDLKQTQQDLAVRTNERDVAREDALANRWQAFLNDAQLEICEKGNRKKMGNCREAVLASLSSDARQGKFSHCIRSGQAQPVVHERQGNADLPDFSEMLNEDEKLVKGWYVEFCDPTLPERDDAPLSEGHLPKATSPG
ncbi:MAG: hypothetical protein H6738_20805 [Alphaproteobacteria bacterium]|nr:hypothetical protein [Alphaproteobacteria bacterium]MCB9699233.1 hypothetical protein [Alphaproteobacteria bacterium]